MFCSLSVKGLALKTLSSLQQDFVTEHLEAIIPKALSDETAYVRRVAVLACVKLHQLSPSSLKEFGLIDDLYGTIRDPDPAVVVNCLSALEEILTDEGGVVINEAMAHYLLRKLKSFPTWSQIRVLDILKKYTPSSEDEVFDIMNTTDELLLHNSSTVIAMCLQLFLHLLHSLPHLKSEVFKRSQAALTNHLGLKNMELCFAVLSIISEAPKEALPHFCNSFQAFFCLNKDPCYLKQKKLEILPLLITEENGTAILKELSLHCLSGSLDASFAAMRALGYVHQHTPSLSGACLEKLCSLIHSSSPHVLSNLLQVLQDMEIADPAFWDRLMSPICQHFHTITDNRGKVAVLYLLGEHHQDSEDTFSVIEDCVDSFADLDSILKIQLLTTTTKLFLAHPFELQSLLGGLLQVAVADADLEVKSRAEFLYSLLESGIDTAKAVLLDVPA